MCRGLRFQLSVSASLASGRRAVGSDGVLRVGRRRVLRRTVIAKQEVREFVGDVLRQASVVLVRREALAPLPAVALRARFPDFESQREARSDQSFSFLLAHGERVKGQPLRESLSPGRRRARARVEKSQHPAPHSPAGTASGLKSFQVSDKLAADRREKVCSGQSHTCPRSGCG